MDQANLAHAYLLQGQYDAAVSTYRELKDKALGDQPYKEILKEDLDLLSQSGITHADVQRIWAMIQIW